MCEYSRVTQEDIERSMEVLSRWMEDVRAKHNSRCYNVGLAASEADELWEYFWKNNSAWNETGSQ